MIVLGAAAGFVATRIMDMEMGVAPTIAVGVIGALVGGLLLRFLLTMVGMVAQVIGAVFGAVLLLWLYKRYSGRSR